MKHLAALARFLVSQAIALAGLWLLRDAIPLATPSQAIVILLCQGAAAAAIGAALGLRKHWLPVQLLLPVGLAFGAALPSWIYFLAFAAIALTFWNSPTERVPLYLTNRATIDALAGLMDRTGAKSLADLGSGTGTVVLGLARARPDFRIEGVESAPPVLAVSALRRLAARLSNAAFRLGSLWNTDLAPYDMVYCFLSPAPMPRLYEKAMREMRPGTFLVSNSFLVPGVEAEETIVVDDSRQTRLYLYRMGAC